MQKTKLISARLDADVVEKIDKLADKHYYWKRNFIINRILKIAFEQLTEEEIYKLFYRGGYGQTMGRLKVVKNDEDNT